LAAQARWRGKQRLRFEGGKKLDQLTSIDASSGFFPGGVILYFTYWYPSVRRGQVIAIFMSATTMISLISGPLCGFVLKLLRWLRRSSGWQWPFLAQGLPALNMNERADRER
jgi:MFS family permease